MAGDEATVTGVFQSHHVLLFDDNATTPAESCRVLLLSKGILHLDAPAEGMARAAGDTVKIESATPEGVYRMSMRVQECTFASSGRRRLVLESAGPVEVMERRDGARVVTRFKVMARQDEGDDEPGWCELQAADANSDGMRAFSPRHFAPGEELSLQIVLPDGHDPIACDGRVAWGRTDPKNRNQVGLVFRNLTPESKERLREYLLRCMLKMA